jgi:hypothetical protein
MMSPTKSICRLVPAHITSPSRAAANTLAYRYDPYCWKALPSPAKNCISPDYTAKRGAAQEQKADGSLYNQENTFHYAHNSVNASSLSSIAPNQNRLLFGAPTQPTVAPMMPKRAALVNAGQKPPLHSFKAALQAPVATLPHEVLCAPSDVTRYVFVDFKHDSATYVAPFKVSVGDVVFVEGDRGEDVGTVSGITTEKPSYPVPCKVIRRFNPAKDTEGMDKKKSKEAAVVKSTQALADSLGLAIQVVDTEFQFDYNKLTVYFNSKNTHIDFRKLQRGLFRDFRCRIWLSNMAEVEYQKKLPRCR